MSVKQQPIAVSPDIEIWTEGKTDWQILRKAHQKLGIDSNIGFHESTEDMGDSELLRSCKTFAKKPNPVPMLFIFDRDNDAIVREVDDPAVGFRNWGNNVYSFSIPIPAHRTNFQNMSIEFYFSDDEIRTCDSKGRRLFLTTEFNEKSGKHKKDATISVGSKGVLKGCVEDNRAKVIDADVFDQSDSNIALSKSSFAYDVSNDVPPFDSFDFGKFRSIFAIIDRIIQESHPQTSVCLPDTNVLFRCIQNLGILPQIDTLFRTLCNILEMTLQVFIVSTIRCYEDAISKPPEQYMKKVRPIKRILSQEFRQPSLKTLHDMARNCYYLVDATAPRKLNEMKECLAGVMLLGDLGQVIEDLEQMYPPEPGTAITVNKREVRKGILDFVVPELAKYWSKTKGSLQATLDETIALPEIDLSAWKNALVMLTSKVEPILSNRFISKTLDKVDSQTGTYGLTVVAYEGSRISYSSISIPAESIEQYQSNVTEIQLSDKKAVVVYPFLLIRDGSLFFYRRTLASGYEYYSIKEDRVSIQETKRKFDHTIFRTGSKQELFWTEVRPVVNPANGVKANIPVEGLEGFVGRNRQIRTIIEEIIEIPNQNGIIYGPGGIGKTALMQKVSKKLFDESLKETANFDNIIWISAKSDYYDYIFKVITRRDPQFRSLDNILFAILEFFSYESLDEYDFEDRKDLALQVLEQNRVLLVLDNFETLATNEADKVIRFFAIDVKRALRTKPQNFKVIITSRKQIPSGFHQVELKGLDLGESRNLLTELHKQRWATKPELSVGQKDMLHGVAKGIPIVLKHCMARIYEYNEPIDSVISRLSSYSSELVQFSYKEILQEVERNDKEGVQLQILLLVELINRPLMARQIADILETDVMAIENAVPTLIDYQCLRRINQDNQEKFSVNGEVLLLVRSLAIEHSDLVHNIRRMITSNFSLDKQMNYAPEEQGIVRIFNNYLANGDYLEAERFIKDQLKKRPDSILICYRYAQYLKEQKKGAAGAIDILENIREPAGNHPDVIKLLLSCHLALGNPDFDKACVYADQLEKEQGVTEETKLELAEFYVRWSMSVSAQGEKLDPLEELSRQNRYKSLAEKAVGFLNSTRTRTSSVCYLFAEAYYNVSDYESALKMINRAIKESLKTSKDYPRSFSTFRSLILERLENPPKRVRH